ncbi:MAG: alpha/beta fold hydrolase [bacterium]|nr:alpha/beta fold hydrolase [bacterium]
MGVRLHVDADGAGTPIVLAHGFGGSARNWNPQVRAFRAVAYVARYDARGHARSEAPDDAAAYTPETFVDDLRAVVDGAGVDRAVVGGLSMGAATALRFALAYPARVRALVLASYPSGPTWPTGFTAIAERFADAIERDGLEAAGAHFVWGPDSGLDERGARLVRLGFLEHPPHGLVHTLRGVIARQPSVETIAALSSVSAPTLVVAGKGDAASLAPSHALASRIPRARLVVVPDAGHVVNLANPAAFDAAMAALLREVP